MPVRLLEQRFTEVEFALGEALAELEMTLSLIGCLEARKALHGGKGAEPLLRGHQLRR